VRAETRHRFSECAEKSQTRRTCGDAAISGGKELRSCSTAKVTALERSCSRCSCRLSPCYRSPSPFCGGIYSAVSSLWSFTNKKFTKGVLWAGPAVLVGNAFLIHTADETWARMCIGWLIAIPLAGAVDLVRLMRSNAEPKLPAPGYQNLESRQRLIAKM